jgi:hypothetical protein
MTEKALNAWWNRRRVGPVDRGLDDLIQQVAKRHKIVEGNYNAGTYDAVHNGGPVPQHRRRIWASMGERQRGEVSCYADVEHSIAKNFWHIVRVYCRRLLIGH